MYCYQSRLVVILRQTSVVYILEARQKQCGGDDGYPQVWSRRVGTPGHQANSIMIHSVYSILVGHQGRTVSGYTLYRELIHVVVIRSGRITYCDATKQIMCMRQRTERDRRKDFVHHFIIRSVIVTVS